MHLLDFFYPGFLFISYMNLFRFFFWSHQWRAPFLCTRPFHGLTNTIAFSGRKSFSQRESLSLRLRLMLSTTNSLSEYFFRLSFNWSSFPFAPIIHNNNTIHFDWASRTLTLSNLSLFTLAMNFWRCQCLCLCLYLCF